MSQHTKEPWEWHAQGDANAYVLLTSDKKWVIGFIQNGGLLPPTQEANARRIVACVNACAGFSTEVIEIIVRAGGMQHKMTATAAVAAQRDDLLAALKQYGQHQENCLGGLSNNKHGCTCGLSAALAKCEGGAQ